jgi:arylsulfatase A-like enzyme
VVFITVDTLARDFLGPFHSTWNTTPNLDALFAESTLFGSTAAVRGFTRPSLVSIHTGMYPRTTSVRDNTSPWANQVPDLFEIFKAAGFHTYASFTNQCAVIHPDTDVVSCTEPNSANDFDGQKENDRFHMEMLLDSLAEAPADKRLFMRLHLMDPHDPYDPVEPHYGELHPTTYEGDLNVSNMQNINAAILDDTPLTEADIAHLHAAYASQVKGTDALIGEFFAGLKELGLYEDALIIFGSDHGEELAARTDYTFHGCSFHNSVIQLAYSIRAPGLPEDQRLDGWISTTDIAPTILDIADIDPPQEPDGRSLLDHILKGESPGWPVFFERSALTAGVISGDLKYVLNPPGNYDDCAPFNSSEAVYENDRVEIYDLAADPEERTNLRSTPPKGSHQAKQTLCTWVTAKTWQSTDTDKRNALVQDCLTFLAE